MNLKGIFFRNERAELLLHSNTKWTSASHVVYSYSNITPTGALWRIWLQLLFISSLITQN